MAGPAVAPAGPDGALAGALAPVLIAGSEAAAEPLERPGAMRGMRAADAADARAEQFYSSG